MSPYDEERSIYEGDSSDKVREEEERVSVGETQGSRGTRKETERQITPLCPDVESRRSRSKGTTKEGGPDGAVTNWVRRVVCY